MSLELFVLLVVLGANVMLGAFVFLRDTSSATNRLFFLLVLAIMIWSGFNYLSVTNTGGLFFARMVLFMAVPFASLFFLFVLTFPRHRMSLSSVRQWLIALHTAAIMALTLSPLVFERIQYEGGGGTGSPVVGPAIALFGLTVIGYDIGGILVLARKTLRSRGIERQQRLYLALGLSLTLLSILIFNFFFPVVLKNTTFIPFAAAFTTPFIAFTSYAIVRHHLLDIRAVVARSVAYVLLLIALGVIYGFAIFGITGIFFSGQLQSTTQQIVYIALAVVLAFTFQPLKRFFEQITNRLFFRDHYETQEVLNELSSLLITEFALDDILQASLKQLCMRLHIASGQFYIFDDDKIYKVEHHGVIPQRLLVAASLQHFTKTLVVADMLEKGTVKEIMDSHGARVALRLHTQDQFVGFLILGDKLSGDVYSSQDLDLLQIATKEIAVAVANAKAYDEIAHFNVTLQEKVEDATKRLRAANRHLKELDVAKDEFISMAAHQLRTPLTGIKGYLSMLIEGDVGAINKEQREFVESAYNGSQRMINLVADLLNVSRMSAGKFMIQKKPVDLRQLVDDETRQLQSRAADRQVQLVYIKPKRALPIMELDEDKTRQVVMNFVDNAIYYTPHGKVKVLLERTADRVELRVIDNGIGVPKEAQSHLFKKFYRAGNAQNVRPDGTGLGLYLAKRVIEDQGGSIIFESAEGKGSTFGFAMPIKGRQLHGAHR